jgi:hypothetical protein
MNERLKCREEHSCVGLKHDTTSACTHRSLDQHNGVDYRGVS